MIKFKHFMGSCLCCLFLSAVFVLAGCSASSPAKENADAQASALSYSVTIGFTTYYGTYTGSMAGGMPDGTGIFTATDDDGSELFTYEGAFSQGSFSGKGQLSYPDGSSLKGAFRQNRAHGNCTETYADGSYSSVKYYQGKPCGLTMKYSSDGALQSRDWYYKKELVSSLKELAIYQEYQDLYHKASDLKSSIVRVEATVVRSWETEKDCTLLLRDAEGHNYLASYHNTALAGDDQAIIPTLQTGDSAVFYSFYDGLDSLSYTDHSDDRHTLGYTYPFLEVFYAEKSSMSQSLPEDPAYEDIVQNPYFYAQMNLTVEGTVLQVEEKKNYYYVKLGTGISQKNKPYFVSIRKKDDQICPAPGDKLKIKGTLNGNYKLWMSESNLIETGEKGYELHPLIKALNIK